MTRLHHLQREYRALWRGIAGAIRAAQHAHPEIAIPEARRPSVVKRAVGQVLAVLARSGKPDESGGGHVRPSAAPGETISGQPPAETCNPQGASRGPYGQDGQC